jgi:hypothetical protein
MELMQESKRTAGVHGGNPALHLARESWRSCETWVSAGGFR